tara:strand:- start:3616 stop:3864 length:249 start_codon:yes stop_codon:yes gene_type:complete
MSKVNCEGCLYWDSKEDESGWGVCMLTSPEAHETLNKQVLYVAKVENGEDLWIPLEETEKFTAFLHTRKDYGCVQYEHSDLQ